MLRVTRIIQLNPIYLTDVVFAQLYFISKQEMNGNLIHNNKM